jgi:metal-responsive CopG/Arc/MetJ family transcriptional regulator
MKNLTVRLPEPLYDEISREAEERKISKSEIVRQRLEVAVDGNLPLVDRLDDLQAFELMSQLLSFAPSTEQAA